jgi:transposase
LLLIRLREGFAYAEAKGYGGERVRAHLAVLTLGYSRRLLVRAFRSEKQDHWLQALEEGFRHWGGVPQEVLEEATSGG